METMNTEVQPQQNNSIVTMGDWVVTLLLSFIPIVNIIMLCIWAFGSDTPISKKNYAKAQLIFLAIGIVLTILLGGSLIAFVMAVSEGN